MAQVMNPAMGVVALLAGGLQGYSQAKQQQMVLQYQKDMQTAQLDTQIRMATIQNEHDELMGQKRFQYEQALREGDTDRAKEIAQSQADINFDTQEKMQALQIEGQTNAKQAEYDFMVNILGPRDAKEAVKRQAGIGSNGRGRPQKPDAMTNKEWEKADLDAANSAFDETMKATGNQQLAESAATNAVARNRVISGRDPVTGARPQKGGSPAQDPASPAPPPAPIDAAASAGAAAATAEGQAGALTAGTIFDPNMTTSGLRIDPAYEQGRRRTPEEEKEYGRAKEEKKRNDYENELARKNNLRRQAGAPPLPNKYDKGKK